MEQLSNFSVETLHCSLAEEVQVDSRIQRAGEKTKKNQSISVFLKYLL